MMFVSNSALPLCQRYQLRHVIHFTNSYGNIKPIDFLLENNDFVKHFKINNIRIFGVGSINAIDCRGFGK